VANDPVKRISRNPANPDYGTADETWIWRRVLSPTESQAIYLVGQNYGQSFDSVRSGRSQLRFCGCGLASPGRMT
jgi:hypothetical protein